MNIRMPIILYYQYLNFSKFIGRRTIVFINGTQINVNDNNNNNNNNNNNINNNNN